MPRRAERAYRPAVEAATGVNCAELAALLPGLVDDSAEATSQQQAHVDACLRCQAELARYRRLLRVLRSIGADTFPPGDVSAILDHMEAGGRERSAAMTRRAAYLGGMVVATAASAAGVLMWATRRREWAS